MIYLNSNLFNRLSIMSEKSILNWLRAVQVGKGEILIWHCYQKNILINSHCSTALCGHTNFVFWLKLGFENVSPIPNSSNATNIELVSHSSLLLTQGIKCTVITIILYFFNWLRTNLNFPLDALGPQKTSKFERTTNIHYFCKSVIVIQTCMCVSGNIICHDNEQCSI